MTFQDTILECLLRVQREILTKGGELSKDELWKVFNGEVIAGGGGGTKQETKQNPKPEKPKRRVVKKKKKKEEELELEVEPWRHGKFGKLYFKCVNTGRLFDPNTEEELGIYTFDPNTELETVTLYEP
jgi:hypothetical protein